MWCAACGRPGPENLCLSCRRQLNFAAPRIVGDAGSASLLVRPSYLHEATARRLVHGLKYDGSRRAARVLAEGMARHVDSIAGLIPVPRTPFRRWRYGVDQAVVLAEELALLTGAVVHDVLIPPVWQARHTGTSLRKRRSVPFTLARPRPSGSIALVDDVVTTGSTLWSAACVLGFAVDTAVVATSADKVTSLQR